MSNYESKIENYKLLDYIDNQSNTLKQDNDTTIYTVVDKMPVLLGCAGKINERKCSDEKLLQYIFKNVKYNSFSRENGIIDSKILVTFVIEKNGETSNIEILKGNEYSNIKEVVQNIPRWKPGNLMGVIKRVKFHLPITVCFE